MPNFLNDSLNVTQVFNHKSQAIMLLTLTNCKNRVFCYESMQFIFSALNTVCNRYIYTVKFNLTEIKEF